MTINQRIKILLEAVKKRTGLNANQIYKKVEVSRQTFNNYIVRPDSNVPFTLIQAFCKEFNVSPEWVIHGKGAIFVETSENDKPVILSVEEMQILIKQLEYMQKENEELKKTIKAHQKAKK